MNSRESTMTRRTPSLRILKMASFLAIALAPALCLGGELSQVSPTPQDYVAGTDFLTMAWSGSGDVEAPLTAVDLLIPPVGGSTSGCQAADFAGFPAGHIALMQRGTCTFGTKAANAEAAGAIGAIIFNEGNTPAREPVFAGTVGGPPGVHIPVVATSFSLGSALYTQTLSGPVVMSISEPGTPAKMWIGLKNSDDVGLRVDLAVEVASPVDDSFTGLLENQSTGNSEFNKALLKTLHLVGHEGGAIKSVTVWVRRTCAGTGHDSGTVRLWYNGQSTARSRFDATPGGVEGDYFLRDNFDLSTTAGSSNLYADAAVDSTSPCPGRPFTALGTWSLP